MKHIPILFSTDMVQAILEGRKKMTRRILPIQPLDDDKWILATLVGGDNKNIGKKHWVTMKNPHSIARYDDRYFTQKYSTGDILWVRESFRLTQPYGPENYYFGYRSGDNSYNEASDKYDYSEPDVWRPSIHMPKEACRIFLKVTDVRCERLHEITEQDAVDEGILKRYDGFRLYTHNENCWVLSALHSFQSLWAKINGQSSWDANPYVWVISFELTDRPADFLNQINK